MHHPLVAYRDCQSCQKWMYDENTGEIVVHPPKTGQPLPRIGKPPCMTHVKCAKGSPDERRELSPRNWQAYNHYLECAAVGQFPDDPIVRRNAAIIKAVLDAEARKEKWRMVRIQAGV